MSAALNCNISFIGGGNMAQALIGGLISQGLPATRITVSDPVEKVRSLLAEKKSMSLMIILLLLKMRISSCLQSNHRF